jgi:hypothetical protein
VNFILILTVFNISFEGEEMTRAAGYELRDLISNEIIALPPTIPGEGFTLVPHAQKIYTPSGAPVILFNVVSDSHGRIGIANLILESDATKVRHVGHIGVSFAQEHLDVELLTRVGRALLSQAFTSGISTARIVVSASDHISVQACRNLQPTSLPESTGESGQLAFFYHQ